MKKIYVISIPVLLIAAFWVGCSGDITPPVPAGSSYYVETILAIDLATDSSTIIVTLDKNDTPYFDATITLGEMGLDTNSTGYTRMFGPAEITTDSSYSLRIVDGDSLDVIITLTVPAAFAIEGPSYRQFDGGAESVQWTPSVGSDAYILATKPPQTSIQYDGYEAYVPVTVGSIPPETFLDGNDRILGTHYIYVAAFTGALPIWSMDDFDIPPVDSPPDNVSISRVSGRAAGMVIAVPDSIIVTE
jgi:hypothetical protein